MKRTLAFAALAVVAVVLVIRGARAAGSQAQAAVVDSVVPREVALAQFRRGLGEVDTLSGARRSREELVRAFVSAVERADTAALRAMTMTRAEYAWLYYPTTPQGLPPYDLSPELLWFLLEGRSAQGLAHLMESRGGRSLRFGGHACDPTAGVEGVNRIHGPCEIRRRQAPGAPLSERLFGPIIERDGRFKFVSLGNRL